MNLPKLHVVELITEFAQRCADHALAVLRQHAGVFVVALKIKHFVDGGQARFSALCCAYPLLTLARHRHWQRLRHGDQDGAQLLRRGGKLVAY